MLAEIGLIATFLALAAALYAAGLAVYGGFINKSERYVLSARNAALTTFPLLAVATGALVVALINEHYQIGYVWSVTDPATPIFYRVTALWGSQAGSLLFWSLLMSGFALGALVINWRSHHRLMPGVIFYLMVTLAFFLVLVLFFENPFERYWIASDGEVVLSALIPTGATAPSAQRLAETANGLNPLLRHFGMIIHPPMLYLGFVGFVIPFAFAMSALASGDLSTNWIKATRRWALVAWLFLALGLILGGRWAYDVLGWGGYWGWDPVENAAFLPWLVGTAFLHSVMIQEKRGMLKVWNMFLVIGAFSAVLFGTFATRSGLVDSVHSFARSEIGFPMLTFWASMTIISIGLILWRWNRGQLKDEHKFTSILSRESLFVLNNVIFVALIVAIFWGSFGAPIISEMFLDTTITLGLDYFNQVTPPLFLILYILMGIAPLSAWGMTSVRRLGKALAAPALMTGLFALYLVVVVGVRQIGAVAGYSIVALAGFVALWEIYRGTAARRRGLSEGWLTAIMALFRRNRRRYGGYVIHVGVTVIGIGIIGSTLFQVETQRTLGPNESVQIDDYTLRYDELFADQIFVDGRVADIAQLTVSRDGQELATLRPRHDRYPTDSAGNPGMTMTIAGSYSTLENDFYVLLVGADSTRATFKIYINPLINLVWWGGLILIVGTFIAAWPTETVPAHVREKTPVKAKTLARWHRAT